MYYLALRKAFSSFRDLMQEYFRMTMRCNIVDLVFRLKSLLESNAETDVDLLEEAVLQLKRLKEERRHLEETHQLILVKYEGLKARWNQENPLGRRKRSCSPSFWSAFSQTRNKPSLTSTSLESVSKRQVLNHKTNLVHRDSMTLIDNEIAIIKGRKVVDVCKIQFCAI
jgi:glutathionylspermidine synthase